MKKKDKRRLEKIATYKKTTGWRRLGKSQKSTLEKIEKNKGILEKIAKKNKTADWRR